MNRAGIEANSGITIALAGIGDVALDHHRAIERCASATLIGAWTRDQAQLLLPAADVADALADRRGAARHHHPEEWAPRYHGVLVTAMYHLVYASLYLLGKPDRVFAQQESLHYERCNDDDLTAVHLQYANGSMAVLLGNWTADDLTPSSWCSLYKLLATEGSISISGRDSLVYNQSGWGSYEYPDYEDSFVYAIDYIVNRCLIAGEAPVSGLDDAMVTQKIIELAQRSAREGRAIEASL